MSDRVDRWLAAGVIDAATAARIRAFEAEHGRARARHTVGLTIAVLAALSVGVGLISVVAANWSDIPVGVRLGADLVLGAGLAGLVLHLDARAGTWGREAALVVLYLWVLASIGLVAQTYHLGGKPSTALATWTLLTAWAMTFVRTRLAAGLWIAGVVTTWVWLLGDHADAFGRDDLAVGLWFVALPVLAWVAVARPVLARRPEIADAAHGWVSTAVSAGVLLVPNLLYAEPSRADVRDVWLGAVIAALCLLALVPLAPRLVARLASERADLPRAGRLLQLLLGELALLLLVALLLPHPPLDWAAAIAFVVAVATAAALASALGDTRAFRACVVLVALRILIAYAELFGSLLGTGLGLIGAGLVAFGLLQLWKRYVSRFEPEAAPREEGRP